MPVEIKELILRASVDTSPGERQPENGGLSEEDRKALIEASVREVLRILERSRER